MKIIMFILFFASVSFAKTTKVVIFDSGFDFTYADKIKLCSTGHRSFVNNRLKIPLDYHGHGTNIAGLIAKNTSNVDYCVIIVDGLAVGADFDGAIEYVATLDIDIVNYSGGGSVFSKKENVAIKKMLDKGVVVVAAAGNQSRDLDKKCNYYPACLDKRVVVVSNNDGYANQGKVVDVKANGKDLTAFGVTLTGTSQSTAVITNKILRTKGTVK